MREYELHTTIFPSNVPGINVGAEGTKALGRLPTPLHQASAVLAFLGLVAGTGSTFGPNAVHGGQSTNVSYRISLPSPGQRALLSVRDRLVAIRHYFGLSISDLARILRVGRPTVYAWMRERSLPSSGHVDRIERLATLAEAWRLASRHPIGSQLRSRGKGGKSLLEYLSDEQLDEQAVRRIFTSLKARLEQQQQVRAVRGQSPAEYAKSHGFAEVPRRVLKRNLGLLAGSRRVVS